MTAAPNQVREYIEALDTERRAALSGIRSLIFQVAPDAEETMRYRMPTHDRRGMFLCAMASQKHYVSLYFRTEVLDAFKRRLPKLDLGKSCIRFRHLADLPTGTLKALLEHPSVTRRKPH